jgi:protein arginine kinase
MKELDQLIKKPTEWLSGNGPASDVVVSSRLRLARNLQGYPFCSKLKDAQKDEIINKIEKSMSESTYVKEASYLRFEKMTDLDRQFLLERHLISRELASGSSKKAVLVTDDEAVSVMVLEEDHLRLQAFQSGLNLKNAWKIVSQIDDDIEKSTGYVFDPRWGYLTACPTNVGTGLRASCMLHLPGLVLTKQVHKILKALSKLNLAARGLYGEGTQATGNLFQFSNQMTLGQREEEIIENLASVISEVIEHEYDARMHLKLKKGSQFEDQIWRAVGVLKSARTISSVEATSFLSLLRLGVAIKIIETPLSRQDLNALFLLIQPAHLQKVSGKVLSVDERDAERAKIIRGKLRKLKI